MAHAPCLLEWSSGVVMDTSGGYSYWNLQELVDLEVNEIVAWLETSRPEDLDKWVGVSDEPYWCGFDKAIEQRNNFV